ncbi:hypothetical protein LG202_06360 [Methylobacillus methanolivorans]
MSLPNAHFRPELALHPDIRFWYTTARQDFIGSNECQWLLKVLHLAIKQAYPANATISAPALVFHFVACTLQAIE